MAPPGRAKNGRFQKKSKLNWIENVKVGNIRRKSQKEINISSDSVRRVCELSALGEELWCSFCDRPLSLKFVENENIYGLASTLAVRCDVCLAIHNVNTCKVSSQKSANRPRFDVNRKVAIGMLDAGLGPTKLNTFLSAVSLPAVSDSLLKRHEREVGGALESLAHSSCVEAIKLEKRLTRDFESSFTSCSSASTATSVDCSAASSSFTSSPNSTRNPLGCGGGASTPSTPTSTRGTSALGNTSTDLSDVSSSTLVMEDHEASVQLTPTSRPFVRGNILSPNTTDNIMKSPPTRIRASFDAGWQRRANQKSYNSRTGHASAMGYFSKKVVGYAVRKTSCRKCSYGVPKAKHDCRKNFSNSAKAMEADMALSLLAKNEDLEKENCVVGVVIGDDDSATIASVRRNVCHSVEKWSDLNHAKKGLSNALYALKGKNKLSTSVIKYLTRCFGYAIKQNRNDVDKVRDAIMISVDHAFDNHDKCGEWCGYRMEPSTYKHKGLPNGKGLQGADLYSTISGIFKRYANNAERLAPCGSSQANESFNGVVMRKHPKSEFYGDSESIDYRVASAVCQKNEGTSYVLEVNNRLGLSPGRLTEKFRRAKDRKRITHSIRKQTVSFKRRRQLLKGSHASKTSANEQREGVSYESECCVPVFESVLPDSLLSTSNGVFEFVVFDLETSGFGPKAEICQIAAVHGDNTFSRYIVPSKGIPRRVTEVTGLTASGGDLFLRGQIVKSVPPRLAVLDFINYLKNISDRVVLVAHNCFTFDARQLTLEIKRLQLQEEFGAVVVGFADTLPLFKDKLPDRRKLKEKFTQVELARAYDIVVEDAHNAISDVKVLAQLIQKVNISNADLTKSKRSFAAFANEEIIKAQKEEFRKAMGASLKKEMAFRVFDEGITIECLKDHHSADPENGIRLLLSQSIDGKPRVTSRAQIINSVQSHIANLLKM